MRMTVVKASRKVATNVSVQATLVDRARAQKLNLSEILERALIAELAKTERARWLDENRTAIEEYNKRITEDGAFGDEWRTF